jgi:hypothetical protein
MYTLQNLYDYLMSGAALSVTGAPLEPGANPAPTGKNTKEIGDAIKGRFDQCNAAATDVRYGKKFFSAAPGKWGVQTGGSTVLGLLKTGQMTMYHRGDDGMYQKGRPFSYTDNGDGTVMDNVTGLMWPRGGTDGGCKGGGAVVWRSAVDWAEGLTFAGYSDWRLPNARELQSLMIRGNDGLYSNTTFITVPSTANGYWSSTTCPADPDKAMCGVSPHMIPTDKSYIYSVRAVRGHGATIPVLTPTATPTPVPTLTPGGALVVIEGIYVVKGLSNAGTCNNAALTHPEAMSWAAGLSYADYSSGWRLPTKDEGESICAHKAELDGYQAADHWTSSEQVIGRYYSMRLGQSTCASGDDPENSYRYVRAVRDDI